MTTDPYEYDVALSFAPEDRTVAEELAALFSSKNIEVFLDEFPAASAAGRGNDMVDHLVNLYARKARYCVILVSGHYPLKSWTEAERSSARERALREPDEYILLVQLDDAEVPGLTQAGGYMDLRQRSEGSFEEIIERLEEKRRERKNRAGPPPQSHDLRSGNVPSRSDTS